MCLKTIILVLVVVVMVTMLSSTTASTSPPPRWFALVCEDFDPRTRPACGRSVNNVGGHWEDHLKQTLPKVAASTTLLSDYALYFGGESMDAGARTAHADYLLAQPDNAAELAGVGVLCVRFEAIQSDPCQQGNQYAAPGQACSADVVLGDAHGLKLRPDTRFDYPIEDWTISNFEFNLTLHQPSLAADHAFTRVLIEGNIQMPSDARFGNIDSQNYVPPADRLPYIAIRKIVVSTGNCPRRIGRRQAFWIFMAVSVVVLNIFTVLYIIYLHSLKQYQRKQKRAAAAASLEARRSASVIAKEPPKDVNSNEDQKN